MKVILNDGTVLERDDIFYERENGFITYHTDHKLKGTRTITHVTHSIPISNVKEIIAEGERNVAF